MRLDLESPLASNIPKGYGIEEGRLFKSDDDKDWTLYVCDHYWVLDIDDHLEFYYNPDYGIGKIRKAELPITVFQNLEDQCVVIKRDGQRFWHGDLVQKATEPLRTDISGEDVECMFEHNMVGNWFYAPGYNYVTTNGMFYDNHAHEWNLWDLKLHDMLRMTCSTQTHRFLRTVWNLKCFKDVDNSSLTLKPFREGEWDSASWKEDFEFSSNHHERSILRFMRQEVFLHTVYIARQGRYRTESGKEVQLTDPTIMQQGTRLFSERLSTPTTTSAKTKILVENIDCLVAAKKWIDNGYKVAVLNMASRQNPGGGVYSGAGAQEENLFRRTNLFQSLYMFAPYAADYGVKMARSRYPLDRNYGGVLSPGATVFRGLEKDGYPLLDEPFSVDIISVPGMNKPDLNSKGMIESSLVEGVKNKMRTIFEIALQNNNDCLILGALGCGSFKNPPKHIARLFHKLLKTEYKNRFRVVEFAILDDHNTGKDHNRKGNYWPFKKEFTLNPFFL